MKPSIPRNLITVLALSLVTPSLIAADPGIPIDAVFSHTEVSSTSGKVTVFVFDAEDATEPVAAQSFYPGEWTVQAEGKDRVRLALRFTDTGWFSPGQPLWGEIEVDGAAVGTRLPLKMPGSGIYASGEVKTGTGFVFPDDSIQTTAGVTTEGDPTVDPGVKDGVSWGEVSGRPAGLDDGDDVGVTVESDPTVDPGVKDGVSWSEVSGRPAGLDDGDDVGITSETDPQVGSNSLNRVPRWNGSALVTGTVTDSGGNIGIGMDPNPPFKLHVNGLGRFEVGSNRSIEFSTPQGWPGFIVYTNDGSRSDIGFRDNYLYLSTSTSDSPPSLNNGLFLRETGRVGIGTSDPDSRLEVSGEIRTTASSGSPRLWGQGRPGTVRYGTTGAESGLCTYGSITYGLSLYEVSWGESDAACPVGTWVCTKDDLFDPVTETTQTCATSRPGDTADGRGCNGDYLDWSDSAHRGWLADATHIFRQIGLSLFFVGGGLVKIEDSIDLHEVDSCASLPVWCCSGAN